MDYIGDISCGIVLMVYIRKDYLTDFELAESFTNRGTEERRFSIFLLPTYTLQTLSVAYDSPVTKSLTLL